MFSLLLLACDTSGPSVSVALWRDGRLLAEMTLNVGLIHSVTFMPLVQDLLERSGMAAEDISHFAVTTGPGSFTGIRIGISAVKAMAYAGGRTVVGCSTLDVMAWPFRQEGRTLVCPLIDARNQRAYAAAWLRDDLLMAPTDRPLAEIYTDLASLANERHEIDSILLLGFVPDTAFPASLVSKVTVRVAPASAWLPRSAVLAEMAAAAIALGEDIPPAQLDATYIARSSAERLFDRGHGN